MTDLRRQLRDVRLPDEDAAFVRARTAARQARGPAPRRAVWPRVAVALALALVAAATFTAPGQAVGEWIRDVVRPRPQPAQHERPAAAPPVGGRLLARGADGIAVLGRRERAVLGRFADAAWSPRGRFAAVTTHRRLLAVTRSGDVRWRVTPPRPPRSPAWAPDGFRLAYLAGPELRVVVGDGTDDRLFWRHAAGVAPAFRPGRARTVAWVDDDRRVRVADVDRAVLVWRSPVPVPPGTRALSWSADGGRLLAAGPASATVFDISRGGRASADPRGRIAAAAFPPQGRGPAVLLVRRGRRSAFVRIGERAPLIETRGRFRGLVWSPDGRWLVTEWGSRWLYVRADGRRVLAAASHGRPLAWAP